MLRISLICEIIFGREGKSEQLLIAVRSGPPNVLKIVIFVFGIGALLFWLFGGLFAIFP